MAEKIYKKRPQLTDEEITELNLKTRAEMTNKEKANRNMWDYAQEQLNKDPTLHFEINDVRVDHTTDNIMFRLCQGNEIYYKSRLNEKGQIRLITNKHLNNRQASYLRAYQETDDFNKKIWLKGRLDAIEDEREYRSKARRLKRYYEKDDYLKPKTRK